MTSLSILDASPNGSDKIIEIAAPCLMALALPFVFVGLGFLDGITTGWQPLAFYLALAGLIYLPATARSCVLAARAYRTGARADLAWYTALPGTLLTGLVTPAAFVIGPYEAGLRAGLNLIAATA